MKTKLSPFLTLLLLTSVIARLSVNAAPATTNLGRSDLLLANYFRAETEQLAKGCLNQITSLAEWTAQREKFRTQLYEMLSLSPMPPRTDLKPVVTGRLEQEQFTVEKLHFQSMPGLYVTGNLYLPKGLQKPAPAILYVCGHAFVSTNGISYGNKTAYQHHGAWFARNGYVCLIIDTVQLGEIQGIHHGTYREGMWWWNARGYSSAGVEAWNSIRALDYLQSRPEVDGSRLGVTGRSGGGAYSWWVAALDDRIKAAAPVAGITDLHNHVIDGVVEGHCDCMFMVNTYRWDYPLVAALVAPRPLLLCNSDKDSIFPLDGVIRVHAKVVEIYKLYGATNNFGLLITDGPHKDTQDLQVPVFRWFNRHLKGEDPLIEMAATRFFAPEQLKVFDVLPSDERTSKIHESFVPMAAQVPPSTSAVQWNEQRDAWMTGLKEKVFRGWPAQPPDAQPFPLLREASQHGRLDVYEFTSEHDVPLRLYIRQSKSSPKTVRLSILDQSQWTDWVRSQGRLFPEALREEVRTLGVSGQSETDAQDSAVEGEIGVFFTPRGLGLNAWTGNERAQVQIRRRFMLLGQTLDSMRVWDIRQALHAVRAVDAIRDLPVTLDAGGPMAVDALYAALFEPGIKRLELAKLPGSHQQGPDYLNVLRVLDIPQTVAMVAQSSQIALTDTSAERWAFPAAVANNLGWGGDRLAISPGAGNGRSQ